MNTLPDKPSDLIRVAIADLIKVEAQPDVYKVNMAQWHIPSKGGQLCQVCLAGAVMAKTLNFKVTDDYVDLDLPDQVEEALSALNDFRTGDVGSALYTLGVTTPVEFREERDVVGYEKDPTLFKTQMLNLADDLQKAGL